MIQIVDVHDPEESVKIQNALNAIKVKIQIPIHSPSQVQKIKDISEYDEDFAQQLINDIPDIHVDNVFQRIKIKYSTELSLEETILKLRNIISYLKTKGAGFSNRLGIHFKFYNINLPIGDEEYTEKEKIFWNNLKNKIMQYEEIFYRLCSRTPIKTDDGKEYFIHRYNYDDNVLGRMVEKCDLRELFEWSNSGVRRNRNSDVEFRCLDTSFEASRIESLLWFASYLYIYCLDHTTHNRKRTRLPYCNKIKHMSDFNLREEYSYSKEYHKLYSLLKMIKVHKKYFNSLTNLFNGTFEDRCCFPEYFKTNDGIIYYHSNDKPQN